MVGLRQLFATAVAVWSCRQLGVIAYPYGMLPGDDPLPFNGTHPFNDYPLIPKDGGLEARQSDKIELRILPLGASIMSGVGSSKGSGLRKWLRMALRYDGYPVNMVGTKQAGSDMLDNDHEAVSGAVLSFHSEDDGASIIFEQLQLSLGYRPNVVIINGGTNNANRNIHVDIAGQKMEEILNKIWSEPDMAETCVILSTLLPTTHEAGARARLTINEQYRQLVNERSKDKCIWLADMEPNYEGRDFFDLKAPVWAEDGEKAPKVHPNDEGHKRMAYVFYAAIRRALRDTTRPVKAAVPKTSEAKTGCDKEFGNGEFSGGLTQHGWGEHDGTYTHNSERKDIVFTIESKWDRDQWFFARLFSRDYDDLLGWYEFAPNDHRYGVWKNLGSENPSKAGEFKRIGDLQGDLYCIPRGVRFIDMTGDGLDDLVCIYPDGSLYLSVNKGGGNGDTLPTFKKVGENGFIKSSEGEQSRVRLADIDGDGRADLGIINDDNTIRFWRNGWIDDIPAYWQDLGVQFTIKPTKGGGFRTRSDAIRFEDINGDGRDDIMWMDIFGETTTFTNTRSCATGKLGDGLHVRWRPAYFHGRDDYSHLGIREYYYDDGDWTLQDRIHFARIYGTKPAFGNLGVQDYVFLEHTKISDDKHQFNVRIWKNVGQGGTKVIADGNKYCNMEGRSSGAMDYVWTWSHGKMKLFPNAGKKFVRNGESFWHQGGSNPHPDIWSPPGGAKWDRRDLHLADWDNDGACDIIYVNPDNGNIRVFINEFPTKKNWDDAFREIDAPHVECEYKRGIGLEDLAVRFADLTGNGRADYLCLHPDGTVKGYLHEDDDKMTWRGQLKYSEAKDRANLRFADVNGDGRDDMIFIDKFNSDSHVWYNRRQGNPGEGLGGSFLKWEKIGKPVFEGNVAGACTYYPDLDGNGRADMHAVMGSWTNEAQTWFNPSCGLRDAEGDDSEGVVDPQLPKQSGNPVDGAGPGDPGNPGDGPDGNCRGMDNRDWRRITCVNDYAEEDTLFSMNETWTNLQVDDAWKSALEFNQCRQSQHATSSFSNRITDFFHGTTKRNCEIFQAKGSGCDTNEKCIDDPGAAGKYIMNSFNSIYAMYWNTYTSIESMAVFTNVNLFVKEFGIDKIKAADNARVAIIVDMVLLGWGLVMGPTWSKMVLPKFKDGPKDTMSAIKDTVNDLVKNSGTIAKDLYAEEMKKRAKDQSDLLGKLDSSMILIAESWRGSIDLASQKLWDGSSGSIEKITTFMTDGFMLDEQYPFPSAEELLFRFKKILSAIMIPQAWSLSPEQIYPVIIRDDAACDQEPKGNWRDTFKHYITDEAYGKRHCGPHTDNKSYWLLGPVNPTASCSLSSSGGETNCDAFGLPLGYNKISSFNITQEDIVLGSINTWEKNGKKNGVEMDSMKIDFFNLAENQKGLSEDQEVRIPGLFRIPVCSMAQARGNWERAAEGYIKPSANFPCDE